MKQSVLNGSNTLFGFGVMGKVAHCGTRKFTTTACVAKVREITRQRRLFLGVRLKTSYHIDTASASEKMTG